MNATRQRSCTMYKIKYQCYTLYKNRRSKCISMRSASSLQSLCQRFRVASSKTVERWFFYRLILVSRYILLTEKTMKVVCLTFCRDLTGAYKVAYVILASL